MSHNQVEVIAEMDYIFPIYFSLRENAMKIDLKLFASFARFMPGKADGGSPSVTEIRDGITVRELLEDLKIPADEVKIVFLNGIHAKGDEILQEGDRLGVFPPVAGG